MSTNQGKYPPTHKWANDGPVFAGVVVGLRWAKGKPEFGGEPVPVLTVEDENGSKKSLWLSGAVRREVTGAAPRYGDGITITRSVEPEYFDKDGETIKWFPVDVNVVRKEGSTVDLSGPGLPPERDDDVPF